MAQKFHYVPLREILPYKLQERSTRIFVTELLLKTKEKKLETTQIPTQEKMNAEIVLYTMKNECMTAHALTWGKNLSNYVEGKEPFVNEHVTPFL